MPLDDETRIEIASLIDNAMKAADANAGKLLDDKLSHVLDAVKGCADAVGAVSKRMDAMDKARDTGDISRRIDQLSKLQKDPAEPEPLAADGVTTMTDVQLRADAIANLFGEQAPPPMAGESVSGYRYRMAKHFKRHSKEFAGVDLSTIKAPEAFKAAEDVIYAAADSVGRAPPIVGPGRLHMRERKTDGHIVREFFGSPAVWMDQFAGPVQLRGTGTFLTGKAGNQGS